MEAAAETEAATAAARKRSRRRRCDRCSALHRGLRIGRRFVTARPEDRDHAHRDDRDRRDGARDQRPRALARRRRRVDLVVLRRARRHHGAAGAVMLAASGLRRDRTQARAHVHERRPIRGAASPASSTTSASNAGGSSSRSSPGSRPRRAAPGIARAAPRSATLRTSNGVRPVTHLVRRPRRARYTSVRASISMPRACSGDMYAGVPTVMPVAVLLAASSPRRAFAIPKSGAASTPESRRRR